MTLIIIIICSLVFFFTSTYDPIPIKENKEYTSRFEKFTIPIEFWADYNKINFSIHNMRIQECKRVKFLLNDFLYKYGKIIEYKEFIDRYSNLVTKYYDKEKNLLQFKNK